MATWIHFASFLFRELVAESDELDTVAHLLYFGDVKVLTAPTTAPPRGLSPKNA